MQVVLDQHDANQSQYPMLWFIDNHGNNMHMSKMTIEHRNDKPISNFSNLKLNTNSWLMITEGYTEQVCPSSYLTQTTLYGFIPFHKHNGIVEYWYRSEKVENTLSISMPIELVHLICRYIVKDKKCCENDFKYLVSTFGMYAPPTPEKIHEGIFNDIITRNMKNTLVIFECAIVGLLRISVYIGTHFSFIKITENIC